MAKFEGPFLLTGSHVVTNFDCGKEALNKFLQRNALQNQQNNSARTFVSLNSNEVAGYYSLSTGSVGVDDAPERMRKGLANHPIPIILMARFAVDRRFQGQGLGAALFKDAIKRTLNVLSNIGARAFVVHAKDEEAKKFYEKLGMIPFESNPMHMYYLIKDIQSTLNEVY